jgi:glucose-1-phosphate thymidylyltransferase
MKGLVLSGGKGSRLRPFTYSGAKQLVPVANTPVLHFPIRQLVEAGVADIGIVVGENEAQIREAMGDGGAFGARFTYIRQEAPLGLAHAVLTSRAFLGDDPFVLYLGDNVLVGGIGDFVEAFRENVTAGVVLKEVEDPRAFGVAEVADGRLVRVVEKPADPRTNLAVIGVYALVPEVFGIIERQRPSARGELEIADTLNGLVDGGWPVRVVQTPRYWIDTGKMEDMLSANRVILDTYAEERAASARVVGSRLEGVVCLGEGSVVEGSDVVGPVCIGDGAVVRGSRVGPYVAVGPGAVVEGCVVEDSIVMEGSVLRGCPGITGSMIGRDTVVWGAPAGSRLTLGDHSRFEAGA